jgi:hypothetical protein
MRSAKGITELGWFEGKMNKNITHRNRHPRFPLATDMICVPREIITIITPSLYSVLFVYHDDFCHLRDGSCLANDPIIKVETLIPGRSP